MLILSTILTVLTGCSEIQLVTEKLESSSIDKIQVITAIGNPMYGADSKIITDKAEIQLFIDTFNSGIIGRKVDDDDLGIGCVSYYDLYLKDKLVARFAFNVNNTNIIWRDNSYYYVIYDEDLKTPWQLYRSSNAETIVVDLEGNEMERPQD